MLEVLNLDKKETVSIDTISNQELSEVIDKIFIKLLHTRLFFIIEYKCYTILKG